MNCRRMPTYTARFASARRVSGARAATVGPLNREVATLVNRAHKLTIGLPHACGSSASPAVSCGLTSSEALALEAESTDHAVRPAADTDPDNRDGDGGGQCQQHAPGDKDPSDVHVLAPESDEPRFPEPDVRGDRARIWRRHHAPAMHNPDVVLRSPLSQTRGPPSPLHP